jgi:hypothetical protein
MGRDGVERASAKVERGSKLKRDLSAPHSVPEAFMVCQEWLIKEMDARTQDARQLMSDGQKLMDTFLFELIPAFKELILGGLTC